MGQGIVHAWPLCGPAAPRLSPKRLRGPVDRPRGAAAALRTPHLACWRGRSKAATSLARWGHRSRLDRNDRTLPAGCPVMTGKRPLDRRYRRPGTDPYPPVRPLQSCPMPSAGVSSFASMKRPFVISHIRPGAVIGEGRLSGIESRHGRRHGVQAALRRGHPRRLWRSWKVAPTSGNAAQRSEPDAGRAAVMPRRRRRDPVRYRISAARMPVINIARASRRRARLALHVAQASEIQFCVRLLTPEPPLAHPAVLTFGVVSRSLERRGVLRRVLPARMCLAPGRRHHR